MKKINLSRETLRNLDQGNLHDVWGGGDKPGAGGPPQTKSCSVVINTVPQCVEMCPFVTHVTE